MNERLQKIIAYAGIDSRRGAERLIEEGRVTVNGQRAELGQKANPATDDIRVDGKALPKAERLRYILVHKPRGVLSTVKRQPQTDRPIITDLVNTDERLYPVGRLDLNSEGLVLMTNDGELTNQITHPRYGHKKTYKVQMGGNVRDNHIQMWERGVQLPDGYQTAPCSIKVLQRIRNSTWLRIIIGEGHKRQIRSMAEMFKYPVIRLMRTHIGPLELGDLPPGHWRELNSDEVKALKVSLKKQQQSPRKRSR